MENTNNKTQKSLFLNQVLQQELDAMTQANQSATLQSWLDGIDSVAEDKANRIAAFVSGVMQKLLGYNKQDIVLAPTEIAENAIDLLVGPFSATDESAKLVIGLTNQGTTITDEQDKVFKETAWKFTDFDKNGFYVLASLGEIRLYPAGRKDKTCEKFVFSEIVRDAQALAKMCLLLASENIYSGKTKQWFTQSARIALDEKLKAPHKTLKELYGNVRTGIKNNVDDAFIIDSATRLKLIEKDSRSDEIIKQYAQHQGLEKWNVDAPNWVIYIKPNQNIDDYPAVRDYLMPYRTSLEARPGSQKWYEVSEQANDSEMFRQKLGFAARSHEPTFAIDKEGLAYDSDGFYTDNMDYYLVALLNSSVLWYLVRKASKALPDGTYQITKEAIEQLPVPDAPGLVRGRMGQLSDYCEEAAGERRNAIKHFRGMTAFNLLPGGLEAKLTPVLQNWFSYDFDAFRNEIIESFKTDIPTDDLELWTDYFDQERNRVFSHNAGLARAEKEIDIAVYELFGLTPDEIDLVERYI